MHFSGGPLALNDFHTTAKGRGLLELPEFRERTPVGAPQDVFLVKHSAAWSRFFTTGKIWQTPRSSKISFTS